MCIHMYVHLGTAGNLVIILFILTFSTTGQSCSSCRRYYSAVRYRTEYYSTVTGSQRCGGLFRRNRCNTYGQSSRQSAYYTTSSSCCSGYDGSSCNDINECTRGTDNCQQTCHNTCGGYYCSCRSGYTGSTSCSDINECLQNNGGCSHYCHNTAGSYYCYCRSGYRLSSNRKSCIDNNPCLQNNGGCSHICHNTPGSYYCSCSSGYRLSSNRKSCIDINECLQNNGGCSHICHNTTGSYYCSCNTGYQLSSNRKGCNDHCPFAPLPRDCQDVRNMGYTRSGVYTIDPGCGSPLHVFCDMQTSGGPWTVFQRRRDGSENFNRNWTSYKAGFGNPNREFWLGLDNINCLTTASQKCKLRIDMTNFDGASWYAQYSYFMVGNSASTYKMEISGYSGTTPGDDFGSHDGAKFSTPDQDNDPWEDVHCGRSYQGGWWFTTCFRINLNGRYWHDRAAFQWGGIHANYISEHRSLKYADMKVKCN